MRRGGTKFEPRLQPRTTSGPRVGLGQSGPAGPGSEAVGQHTLASTSPRVNPRLGMCQSSPPVPLSAMRRGGTKVRHAASAAHDERARSFPSTIRGDYEATIRGDYEATIQGDLRSAFCSAVRDE